MLQELYLKHGWWIAVIAFVLIFMGRFTGSDLLQGIITLLAGLVITSYYGLLATNWQGFRDQLFEYHRVRITRLRTFSLWAGTLIGLLAIAGGIWLLVR